MEQLSDLPRFVNLWNLRHDSTMSPVGCLFIIIELYLEMNSRRSYQLQLLQDITAMLGTGVTRKFTVCLPSLTTLSPTAFAVPSISSLTRFADFSLRSPAIASLVSNTRV